MAKDKKPTSLKSSQPPAHAHHINTPRRTTFIVFLVLQICIVRNFAVSCGHLSSLAVFGPTFWHFHPG